MVLTASLVGTGPADLLATPVLAAILLVLVRIDLRERRLPDHLTLPLLALGLALAAWRDRGVPFDHLVGAAAGYLVFWGLGELYFRLRGEDGLGQGDAKLLAAAGAWLGWRDLPALVLAAALGALVGASLRRDGRRDIAFGPWLAGAFLALWLLRLAL